MKLRSSLFFIALLMPLFASAVGPVQRSEVASGEDSGPPVQKAVGKESFDQFIKQVQYDSVKQQEVADPDRFYDIGEKFAEARKSFKTIIVINRDEDKTAGEYSQKAKVYYKNAKGEWSEKVYKVSTGIEDWLCERETEKRPVIDPQTGQQAVDPQSGQPKFYRADKGGWKQVWAGTPTGCYPITRCVIDYKSKQFGGASMPHACFFDGGRAVHMGDPNQVNLLGEQQASHGCVRFAADDATNLFGQISSVGQRLNPYAPEMRAQCSEWANLSDEQCQATPKSVAANQQYEFEVQRINSGAFGNTPSADMPTTPSVSKNCEFDPKKPRSGTQAIVMVMCKKNVMDAEGKMQLVDCAKSKQPEPKSQQAAQAYCQEYMTAEAKKYNAKQTDPKKRVALPAPLSGEYLKMAQAERAGQQYVPPPPGQPPVQQSGGSFFDQFRTRSN